MFPEPLAFSARVHRHLALRAHEFDLIHDNQCLGWGIKRLEKFIPTIVTLHHPITRDRALEMAAAPNFYKRWSIGRWYSFVKMQGKVASQMPRVVVVSENSINDIHADMGVALDRMRLVPVGVDPELFTPLPHIERKSGRLITTASADVALKGLAYLIEAMVALREEGRDISLTIIGRPKPGKSMDLIDRYNLHPHIEFVSGVSDERIVELYAEAELAVFRACTKALASLPSKRCAPVRPSSPPMVALYQRSPVQMVKLSSDAQREMCRHSPRQFDRLLTNQRPVPQSGLLADSVSPSAGRGGTAPNSPLTNTEKFSTCPTTAKLQRNGRL